jgi:predicted N-acyltransferase
VTTDELLAAWRDKPPTVTNRRGLVVNRAVKLLHHFRAFAEFDAFLGSMTAKERKAVREQLSEQEIERHFAKGRR